MERFGPLAALVAGTTAGGAFLGMVIGVLWFLTPPEAKLGVGLGASILAGAAVWSRGIRQWIPERACQVSDIPRLTQSKSRAALRWGVPLGLAVRTHTVTPAVYALLAVALAQPHPFVSLLICVSYGFTRGSTIAGFALVRPRDGCNDPGEGLERTLRLPVLAAIVAGGLSVAL